MSEQEVPVPGKGGRPKGTISKPSTAVRRVREKMGLTQVEMAQALGLTEVALQRLERLGRLPASAGKKITLAEMAAKCGEIYP